MERSTIRPLEFQVGTYTIKAVLDGKRICVRAYSEISGKMFEHVLEDKDLTEKDKGVFDDCETVFVMMEQSVIEKRNITLNDVGELRVAYCLNFSKKSQVERTFQIKLKEVEIGDSQRLAIKVERLEAEMREIRAEMEQLKPAKFEKIVPELDLTTNSIAKAAINGLQITTNKGVGQHLPFCLTTRLDQERRQSFEMEVMTVGSYHIWLGVAGDTLRNGSGCYSSPDSVAIYFANGSTTLYHEGKSFTIPTFQIQNGYRIIVKMDRITHTITWELSYPVRQRICEVSIPASLQAKTLLPVVHLYCSGNIAVKFV